MNGTKLPESYMEQKVGRSNKLGQVVFTWITFSCMFCMFCLKGAEIQQSLSLVCVPLDVEDTLSCYHQALERRPHYLQIFQHSRSLLLLLLAYTQPGEFSSD